jgi:hypothetical protein
MPERNPASLSPLNPQQKAAVPLHGPAREFRISHPSLAASFIPVIGPAWEAAADFQDGDYWNAALNGAFAVADAVPGGFLFKGIKAATKGIGLLKKGSLTANAATKMIRSRSLARAGEEIHHVFPLDGLGRNVESWKNHYPFLKTLPKEVHRRLHGSWNGLPQYGPIARAWHGTTDWMKALPVGILGYGGDTVQNLTGAPANPPGTRPTNPRR